MSDRSTAIIIGSHGGIGSALVAALRDERTFTDVIGLSRHDGDFDLTDEASIKLAAERMARYASPSLIIVATGMLSEGTRGPEKTFKDIDADWMMRNFAINTVGPALIAKHFLPLLPRDQLSVFAALSARVGSISDNRLGGWYSYRAAKAALNMTIKNAAIELSVAHKRAICVALHPGTVDTNLSKPFQGRVAPGRLFDAERAALQLLDVIETFKPSDSGKCFAWDGEEIPA
jgi:NAD(P)-dependent dehydrogenase (short-subunit alcohol dehydrogenase family)